MGCVVWIVVLPTAGLLWLIPTVGPFLSLAALGGGLWLTYVISTASDEANAQIAAEKAVAVVTPTVPEAPDMEDDYEWEPVKVRTIEPSGMQIADLRKLESIRTRIVGTGYQIEWGQRKRFGGASYLLVLEPENAVDPLAVAVYGRGRRVGYLSAKRAAMLHPLLTQINADAFRVAGKGVTENSGVLHIDLPRIPELRRYVKEAS